MRVSIDKALMEKILTVLNGLPYGQMVGIMQEISKDIKVLNELKEQTDELDGTDSGSETALAGPVDD